MCPSGNANVNLLDVIVRALRETVSNYSCSEYVRSYKALSDVHVFQGELAAIEVELERRENRIWIFLRKGPVPEHDTYFLPRNDKGDTVRGHLRNVAVGNRWIAFTPKRKVQSDADALEEDIRIIQSNVETIFSGEWELVPYAGHPPFPFPPSELG